MRRVLTQFDAWRRQSSPLVLATVCGTAGSTYSKTGQRVLFEPESGHHAGLVSGGCLETDLAAHASDVLRDQQARLVQYDLRDPDQELFGLATGCRGMLEILLQPLLPSLGYEPFARIGAWQMEGRSGTCAVVIESTDPEVPPGATLLYAEGCSFAHGLSGPASRALDSALGLQDDGARRKRVALPGNRHCIVQVTAIRPLPRLLVIGSGLDAVPLVNLARELGFLVTVADHREAQLNDGRFAAADQRQCSPPGQLPTNEPFDAVVVMTHHLPSDRAWLAALSGSRCRYLGLLGPAARRSELLASLGERGSQLATRIHGPAGLPIGSDSPESIALSILAEIQWVLSPRPIEAREPHVAQA